LSQNDDFGLASDVDVVTTLVFEEDAMASTIKRTSCGYDSVILPLNTQIPLLPVEYASDLAPVDCESRDHDAGYLFDLGENYWQISGCPRANDVSIVKKVSEESQIFTNGSFSITSPAITDLVATSDVCMTHFETITPATPTYDRSEVTVITVAHHGGYDNDLVQLVRFNIEGVGLQPGAYSFEPGVLLDPGTFKAEVRSTPIINAIIQPDGIEFLRVLSGNLTLTEISPQRIAGEYILGVTTNTLTVQAELSGSFDVELEDI